jgi:hypothetical protein
VHQQKEWWLENRDHSEVFVVELEQTLRVVALLPRASTPYVPKVACHLYYTFDDEQVIVRAFWGARRDRGPRLHP